MQGTSGCTGPADTQATVATSPANCNGSVSFTFSGSAVSNSAAVSF